MSSNCLVTKLKGAVQNDNLPQYNTIRVKMHIDSSVSESARGGQTVLNTTNPITITIPEEGVYVRVGGVNVKTFTSDSIKGVLWPTGDYTLEISNKYVVSMEGDDGNGNNVLMSIPLGSFSNNTIKPVIPTSELAYAQNFKGFRINNYGSNRYYFEGDLAELSECNHLEYLHIDNNLTGEASDIEHLTGLKALMSRDNNFVMTTASLGALINLEFIRYTNCPNFTGSITSLGALTKLKNVTIYTTPINGNFDDMLTALSTAGKSDTCTFMIANWGAQRVTSATFATEIANGTAFTVKFNGDGTWQRA